MEEGSGPRGWIDVSCVAPFIFCLRLESRPLLRVALIVSDRAGVTAVAEAAFTF